MSGEITLGAVLGILQKTSEYLSGRITVGAEIAFKDSFFEVLDGSLDIFNTREISTIADITIPPGGALVIDAENYTMLLDNVNVIDRHSGEWIWLSRDTVSLELSAVGVSVKSMEVYYIARYL